MSSDINLITLFDRVTKLLEFFKKVNRQISALAAKVFCFLLHFPLRNSGGFFMKCCSFNVEYFVLPFDRVTV